MKKDLVCHMQVDETKETTAKFLFNGNYYYFCSTLCLAQFMSAPEYYIEMEEKSPRIHRGHGNKRQSL
jgi:YHS domain-containing protein